LGTVALLNEATVNTETPKPHLLLRKYTIYAVMETLGYRLNRRSCKCCEHANVKEVDLLFFRKEINQEEAARRLGCSSAYYSIHFTRDVQRPLAERVSPAIERVVVDVGTQVTRMKEIFEKLLTRCEKLLDSPIEEVVEGRIKAIASEARQTAEFLCRLEGTLTDSPTIQINQLNIKYTQLVGLINEVLCPACQARLMGKLGEVPRVLEVEPQAVS
jgi:hypothetical protein